MSALPQKQTYVRFVPKADISPVGHNVVPVPVYSRNHRKLDGYLRTRPFRFGSASTRARDRAMLKASKLNKPRRQPCQAKEAFATAQSGSAIM